MGSQTDQLPGRQHLGPAVLFGSICDDDGNGDRAGGGAILEAIVASRV